jgi:hypothetical protein
VVVVVAVDFRLALYGFRFLFAGFRLLAALFTRDTATSAISQRGHVPGCDDVTAGCIGQTYLAAPRVCAATMSTAASPRHRLTINKQSARDILDLFNVPPAQPFLFILFNVSSTYAALPQVCAESLWLSGLPYFNHLERLRLAAGKAAPCQREK